MKKGVFIFICIACFILSFIMGIIFKLNYDPTHGKYKVNWTSDTGDIYKDISYESSYGIDEYHKFDLYVPKDNSKESYGLIVYLHAGGFTTGDKLDDEETLKYYASKGYITAGINYTLRTDETESASVYTESMEIKDSIFYVINKANELGYNIDKMAIGGGSAGGCLALLYAYRDANTSLVPVKLVFEAVGPSSFYKEDWKTYGTDVNVENAIYLFSAITGENLTEEIINDKDMYDEVVKNSSALLWVNENSVPTVMAYGKYDKVQPFEASVRLDKALTESGVDHKYFVMEHSGHGLQNDTKEMMEYMDTINEYLDKYMSIN